MNQINKTMAQDNYMMQLKEVVKALPNGWKGQVTGNNASKKVLFNRMMNRDCVAQMTASELELLNCLLEMIAEFKRKNEKIEKEIHKAIAQ